MAFKSFESSCNERRYGKLLLAVVCLHLIALTHASESQATIQDGSITQDLPPADPAAPAAETNSVASEGIKYDEYGNVVV